MSAFVALFAVAVVFVAAGYGSKTGNSVTIASASGNSGLVVWTQGTVEPANRNLAKDDCPKFIVIGPSSRPAEGTVTVKPGESQELSYTLDSCMQ